MEQLQLEVEGQLFNQDEGSLVEMIEILGIEDDVAGFNKYLHHRLKNYQMTVVAMVGRLLSRRASALGRPWRG